MNKQFNILVKLTSMDLSDATKAPLQLLEEYKGCVIEITETDLSALVHHPLVEELWHEQQSYWHWDCEEKTFKKYFYPCTAKSMLYFSNITWIVVGTYQETDTTVFKISLNGGGVFLKEGTKIVSENWDYSVYTGEVRSFRVPKYLVKCITPLEDSNATGEKVYNYVGVSEFMSGLYDYRKED